MSGHIKVYSCLCSESADHATWIPDLCRGHETPVFGEAANAYPGGVTAEHSCGERLCSGGIRDLGGVPSHLQSLTKLPPLRKESA